MQGCFSQTVVSIVCKISGLGGEFSSKVKKFKKTAKKSKFSLFRGSYFHVENTGLIYSYRVAYFDPFSPLISKFSDLGGYFTRKVLKSTQHSQVRANPLMHGTFSRPVLSIELKISSLGGEYLKKDKKFEKQS